LRGVSSVARHITGHANHDFLSSFTAQNALHRLLHFKCDLANMEQAKSMPKTDKLIKIANYFGVEVSYFIE
jgi:transcriptional regulator with XRE-family HTH domain